MPGPVNIRPTTSTPGGRSNVFCYDMDEVQHANLIRDFSKLDFFASMPISIYEGEPFGDRSWCLSFFTRKHTKSNMLKPYGPMFTRSLRTNSSTAHGSPYRLGGYNKLRLGLLNDGAGTAFLNAPLIEFRAAGILMKHERTGEWFNGLQGSDSQSSLSASSTSSRQSATSHDMVVYDVPIRFNDTELLKLLTSARIAVQSVSPRIWNPGKFNCT